MDGIRAKTAERVDDSTNRGDLELPFSSLRAVHAFECLSHAKHTDARVLFCNLIFILMQILNAVVMHSIVHITGNLSNNNAHRTNEEKRKNILGMQTHDGKLWRMDFGPAKQKHARIRTNNFNCTNAAPSSQFSAQRFGACLHANIQNGIRNVFHSLRRPFASGYVWRSVLRRQSSDAN